MLNLRVTIGASASLFALMLMSSVASADGASVDAGVGDDTLVVCDDYPVADDGDAGQVASPEQIKGECTSEDCSDIEEEFPNMIPVDLEGVDPVIYQNDAGGAPIAVRQTTDRDAANTGNIPDLCDTAGPGWNWLCSAN